MDLGLETSQEGILESSCDSDKALGLLSLVRLAMEHGHRGTGGAAVVVGEHLAGKSGAWASRRVTWAKQGLREGVGAAVRKRKRWGTWA